MNWKKKSNWYLISIDTLQMDTNIKVTIAWQFSVTVTLHDKRGSPFSAGVGGANAGKSVACNKFKGQ